MAQDGRLLSLDIFRGMTIAGMIVVNSPGNNTAYAGLSHSHWNGCTFADLVFPFFLFIAGTALDFSFARRRAPISAVSRRAGVLIALGFLLNAIPNYQLATFRFAGVLQRIALCYTAVALLLLTSGLRTRVAVTTGILVGYWLLMTRVPVPGFGAGVLTPEGSLASYLDRRLFGAHTYFKGPFDPEGFLSTFPAVATTLLGQFAGAWLRSGRSPKERTRWLAAAGISGLVLGLLWGRWFPVNKSLWTSSYVLVTGGGAAALLAALYWTVDVRGWKAWSKPFEVFGTNAIAAYVLHLLLLKTLVYTRIDVGGGPVSPRILLCDALFGTWLSPLNASLAFALAYAGFWLAVLSAFYRRKLFLKV